MKFKRLPKHASPAFLALLVTYIIWAAAGPVVKLTLNFVPPFTFLFLRFLLVCIILLPYIFINLKRNSIGKKDYWNFILMGTFSQSSIIFIFIGLEFTTAIDAAIIGTVGPLLSMAAGHYFYNDKVNSKIKFGVLMATVGSLLVAIEPILEEGLTTFSETRLFGNFMVIVYNISFLMYIIWSKISMGEKTKNVARTLHFMHLRPMSKKYSPVLLMSVSFYIGMTTMIPFAILENLNVFGQVHYNLFALDTRAIMGIIYMAILSSIVAYFLFEWALKKTTVSDTAILGYLSPLLAAPFALLLLGEIPTLGNLIGGVIIAVGVLIAECGQHKCKIRV